MIGSLKRVCITKNSHVITNFTFCCLSAEPYDKSYGYCRRFNLFSSDVLIDATIQHPHVHFEIHTSINSSRTIKAISIT